jgi:hypothetical protein
MTEPTRIEAARRKLRVARYAIGVTVAAALAGFAGLARVSHPATHHGGSSLSPAAAATDESTNDGGGYFGDDDSSLYLGPSGSAAPQVQSGGS